MEIQESLDIVRKLANGVHPVTGEIVASDGLYQHPQVVRALHCAIVALEFQQERVRTRRFLPANAGKSWSSQEDAQICGEVKQGIGFQEIAKIHSRTLGSVIARLVRMGTISANPQTRKTA
jgi:hypothetical protein